ncbi:arginine--tRNA ligase [Caldisericum sp.]|uniref:arginine--tRNA ligase n=1 Tax=Caldisericum sp. TaxID=2499687 RepID=UPI003D0F7A6E
MNIIDIFRKKALKLICECGFCENVVITKPPKGFGDFTISTFSFAKMINKPPQEVAKEITQMLQEKDEGDFEKIVASGPYVNFYINTEKLAEIVFKTIIEEKVNYGKGEKKKETIILEHTSANPNGPLHVGRARNPMIGDTLAKILRFAGYDVKTWYWVNDVGKQVASLAWGVMNLSKEDVKGYLKESNPGNDREMLPDWLARLEDKEDHKLVPYYQEVSRRLKENDKIVDEGITWLIRELENGNPNALSKVKKICDRVLDGMKETLEIMNVNIDEFVYESKTISEGVVKKVIEGLKRSKYAKEEDGAYYLDLEEFGIAGMSSKFYFARSDGTSLYATRDIAFHIDKLSKSDIALNILGEDHKLEAKQLEIALSELGIKKKPESIFYSFVSLPEGKMSTRAGRVVYLDDLIIESIIRAYQEVTKRRPDLTSEERWRIAKSVGIGAIRYNIVKVQAEKQIVFKWEEALNFEGNSAPFVQYAHARACSILEKAKEDGLEYKEYDVKALKEEYEKRLVKSLAFMNEVIEECARERKTHPLPAYAHEIATLFNQFYKYVPVLKAEDRERNVRLALVDATRVVLRNCLQVMGIEAIEEM